MTFVMQEHRTDEGRLLAACDADIVGETFTEGETQLILDEEFYGTDHVELLDVLDALDGIATANLAGEALIEELVDADIIEEDEVKHVDGVPHVQLFFI